MTHPAPFPPPASAEPQFEHERFDIYRVALEFQALVPHLVPRRGHASLRDQLDRASASILLNVSEGCGRSSRSEKASFYGIARGSATECASVLDVLLVRELLAAPIHRGRALCSSALRRC